MQGRNQQAKKTLKQQTPPKLLPLKFAWRTEAELKYPHPVD